MPDVADLARRSRVLWLRTGQQDVLLWHVWHDGAAWVVGGGAEQPLPALLHEGAAEVVVAMRDPERRSGRPVQWRAAVSQVEPGTPEWDEVVPRLHAQRLNAADGEEQPARWARESTVLRLAPTGELLPVEAG